MRYLYHSLLSFFAFMLIGLYAGAQHIHPDSLSVHVHYLSSDEMQGRGLGTAGKDKATAYIQEQFRLAGLKPFQGEYTQPFELKFSLARVRATNVIGMVEGSDPNLRHEYLVLGAHYDHLGYNKDKNKDTTTLYPGADDNASGVAAVIELAKYFGQEVNRPGRSLIFIAFDAEESGLLGSKYFIETLDEMTRQQIKVMFSFDMVGMLEANRGLNLKGIGTLKGGAEMARRHAGGISLRNLSGAIEARTDTEPFGLKGIPAVHVFTGLKSPYHKPEDKAELLDYEGMGQVTDFMVRLVSDLADQPGIEAVRAVQALRNHPDRVIKPFGVGLSTHVGTGRHLYKDEFFNAKNDLAFSVGLHLNYRVTRSFALQLEGHYDQNASRTQGGRFARHSVMVPLNLQVGGMGYVEAGTYFKYHFDGHAADMALDFENTYRRQEWGYNLGVGLRYSHYHLGLVRRGSFHSVFRQGPRVVPTALYLSFGYTF